MPVTTAEEMRRLRRQEPFRPFRIHTKSGEIFDIRDPMNILVGETVVLVPVRSDPADLYGDFGVGVMYDEIARVELPAPAPGDGVKA